MKPIGKFPPGTRQAVAPTLYRRGEHPYGTSSPLNATKNVWRTHQHFIASILALVVAVTLVFRAGAAEGVTLDAAASTKEIDDRLAAMPPGMYPHTAFFAFPQFPQGPTFLRNPYLWCANLVPYLTCFSPWNSNERQFQGGTLITPKHAIFAEHFSGRHGSNTLHAGDKVLFVNPKDVVYTRTLKDTPEQVPGSDICVGTFTEADLPPDIIPARVFPPGVKDSTFPVGTPIIYCNKDKHAQIGELVSLNGVTIRPATKPSRVPFTTSGPAFVGDSGSPIFLVVDGRPILLALFLAPNAGPAISAHIDGINALLGRGYKLDVLKVSKP